MQNSHFLQKGLTLWYSDRGLSKYFKTSTLSFHSNPVHFYECYCKNQKGSLTSCQFLFKLQNIVRKIPFSLIYLLVNFAALDQVIFSVISKIEFSKLCKSIHDVIVFPVLIVPLNMEKRKEENILRTKRAFQMP